MAGPDALLFRPSDAMGPPHDPPNAIIGPRPIGWISSSTTGACNTAPYSLFNVLFKHRSPLLGRGESIPCRALGDATAR